ncbi:hypothetical protein CHS0354_008489 [Potamilus streckersoni]|uniref:PiggyBac transposable element-derived protein domain-containing protein n=1 Tax=Potamilus streckersoni TaxID=2493646 RepID=A0AAE0SEN4_9BIVA|nr:hypothetical protein CHS0354_008489 [Potamilus streckersoni]
MAEFEESSEESEMSDFELSEDLNNFDLVNMNENERRRLERQWNALVSDSDDDEEDFEGFEPEELYAPRGFVWMNKENQRDLFQFSDRVGPTRVLDGSRKASEYFQIFYSNELFDNIVRLTNLNATIKRGRGDKGVWTDLSLDEIKAFYGILIIMDTMKFERDELYWSESDTHWLLGSKIGQVMSRDRFFQIKRYLHFSDDKRISNDKLQKVRYLLDHLRRAFQSEYVPHKQVTVDEAMVPFKGRLSLKQYIKDKPVKFGIKIWVLADAVSSYCYNFDVYVGKNAKIVNGNLGLSSKVVIALAKPIEMKGYEIYTNNFFTSPHLADYLYQRKTYLCGTVRTNRKDYPKALVQSNAAARRMCRGTSDWLMSGPLLASYWKDKRIVYYLSSCHRPVGDQITVRRNKDGTNTSLSCTPTVTDYAKYMGGVDRLDQRTRLSKEKKNMQWYRRIEIKLRECALFNAFVLEGTVVDHNPPGKRARDFLSFRMDVAHELIGNKQGTRTFKRPRQLNIDEERLDEKAHWPVPSGSVDRLCEVCNKKHKNYKASHPGVSMTDNPFKRSKSSLMCGKCKVPLCITTKSTCFVDFHTKVYYWQ